MASVKKDPKKQSQLQWLMPVILATQEAKFGTVAVQGQPKTKSLISANKKS
jgi:hypothetical protein